jgi:hypothetical protein
MSDYTVILLRPKSVALNVPFGIDTYTATVTAPNLGEAVVLAQKEAFRSDRNFPIMALQDAPIEDFPASAKEYRMVVTFEGHHSPCAFGWQSPWGN